VTKERHRVAAGALLPMLAWSSTGVLQQFDAFAKSEPVSGKTVMIKQAENRAE